MSVGTAAGGQEALGLRWLRGALDAGLLRTLSDREWRTLSALLLCFDGSGHCRMPYRTLAVQLNEETDAAAQRLRDLAAARVRGEPVIWLVDEPVNQSEISVWLNHNLVSTHSSDLGPVFHYAEQVMGRPLSNAEIQAMWQWHGEYGLEREVIVELLEECYHRDKKHLRYLDAVARRWYDEGVRSLADLQKRREQHRDWNSKYGRIVNHLRLGRSLTGPEMSLVRKWVQEWAFSDEVILQACDAAVGSTRPLLYVNKVLEQWHAQGVRTVADAQRVMALAEAGAARYPKSRPRKGKTTEVREVNDGRSGKVTPAPAGQRFTGDAEEWHKIDWSKFFVR